MIAMERGRRINGMMLALAAVGVLGASAASAQLFGSGRPAAPKAGRAATEPPKTPQPADEPKLVVKAIPVNPTDPIALVNSEVISRQQLADECVARSGKEILETLIARRLIDQALKARKLEVTAADIDQEIDNIAMRMAGINRETWLRTLDKERGISPIQYARDIIYPALALRKLARDRVTVTEDDVKMAFESQYGDKIRCRLIMIDKQRTAMEIWEKLRKNQGAGFEKLAQDYSMDTGSRSLGGLMTEPISRHANPTNVSNAAFRELVDGDPNDKDPSHKPKNGAFSGPIQVAEATWVILKREEVLPAQAGVSLKNEAVHKQMHELIYDVKVKEAMSEYFVELMKASEIDNKLTGRVKLANEDLHPDHKADGDVKLMGGVPGGAPPAPERPAAAATGTKGPAPVGAPADDTLAKQADALKKAPLRK